MSGARTERLLNLLTLLLNARRPLSLDEIRDLDEFEAYRSADPKIGERAFERDKAALLELGIPLRYVAFEADSDDEHQGGYIVDRDRYYLPPLDLEPSQVALLSIAGAAAAALDGFPGRTAVVSALAKLGFDVDADTRPAPSIVHAPFAAGLDAARLGENLDVLHDAVARRCRVRLTYHAASNATTQREVDPYGLYYRQGAWYLVGFCHLRQAERTFHLARIAKTEFCGSGKGSGRGKDFEIPSNFNLDIRARRRPWEFPNEPALDVVLHLAPRLAPAIAEIFGGNAQAESIPTGTRVRLQVTHREALIATILPYGAAIEVLSPSSVRHEISALYQQLSQRYQPNQPKKARP